MFLKFLLFVVIFTTVVFTVNSIVVSKNSKQSVFVTGDINGLGVEVVKQLTSLNIPVRALVPSKNNALKSILDSIPLVKTIVGESNEEEPVQLCLGDCIAAITMVSGKTEGDGSAKLDYAGNSNVVEQAGILGVERILLVTSAGCGETKISVNEDFMKLEETFIQAKNKAEKDLRMYTNLDWTIVRPGNVIESVKSTGKAILTSDIRASGDITATDLSTLLVKLLLTPGNKYTRKELTALDPTLSASSISSSISSDTYKSVDPVLISNNDL